MNIIIEFLFPEKSKWVDISCFENGGYYYLIQMRVTLKNNKKHFRVAKIGFINDHTQRARIYTGVLSSSQVVMP